MRVRNSGIMVDRPNIEYTVTSGRAEITLDRPEVYNAFTPEMLVDLNETILSAMHDPDVYAILLTGRGDGFCSGADVTEMNGREDRTNKFQYSAHLWKVQYVDRLLYFGPKPTIAAVNGPAVGAGSDFALACDFRIMSDESFFRQQFVNIGLVPGDGGGWLLPRLVGESKAKQYLMTGRDIDPAAAEDMGLVVEVVPDGETKAAGVDLATELRDKPRTAVQHTKELIDTGQSFSDYAAAAQQLQWECIESPEHQEAVEAFNEGREPDFDRQR